MNNTPPPATVGLGRWTTPTWKLLVGVLLGLMIFPIPHLMSSTMKVPQVISALIVLVVVLIVFRQFHGGSAYDLGVRPPRSTGAWGWALGIAVAAAAINAVMMLVVTGNAIPTQEANATFGALAQILKIDADAPGEPVPIGPPYQLTSTTLVTLTLMGAVIGAAVSEELIFRGLMYRGLRDSLLRRFRLPVAVLVAAVLQAVLFLTVHPTNIVQIVVTGFAAIAWAYAYERTGSLWVTMVSHSLFNQISLAILVLGPHRPLDFPLVTIVGILVGPVIVLGVAALTTWLGGNQPRIEEPLATEQ